MMDLLSQVKTVDLMLKFLRGDMQHITPYPFQAQKKKSFPLVSSGDFPRSTPETEGIPSEYIQHFFEELDQCNEIHVHSIMLLRHGKIIAEGNFKPYSGSYPHMVFSLSKSVTGMAVGMAVTDGLMSLDEKVIDIFPEKGVMFRSPKINNITVRHLLNMTSGIKFNEVGSYTEKDWVKAFLLSDCTFEPGSEFYYNSMNSYLLSAIVCKRTGMGLVEYLNQRLFTPLGIEDVTWDTCPLGIEKGGWGLYLRIADMAKLGQLYLQHGRWTVNGEDRQLIPEEWIEESTQTQISTRETDTASGYGYQIWNFGAKDAYQYNGVFGQYVVVLPDRDMVVAITSGSQHLFSDPALELVEKYFGDHATALVTHSFPNNIKALRSLRNTLESLNVIPDTAPKPLPTSYFGRLFSQFSGNRKSEGLPRLAVGIDHKQYRLESSFGTLMPFILQVATNNFSYGISRAFFTFEPGVCVITLHDGNDEHVIRAGLDGVPRRGSVTRNDEVYAIGATAQLTTDEDDRTVLKLFVSFIETPCIRVMKFIFYGDKLLIRFFEVPSVQAASQMLFGLIGGGGNSMNKMLFDTISQQRLMDRVDTIMMPRAKGTLFDGK